MLDQTPKYKVSEALAYLAADFDAESVALIAELAERAAAHIAQDSRSTVTMDIVHQVAKTLVEGACDARTVMIFFLSILEESERDTLRGRFPNDMLEAAHNISIIRLLGPRDAPKHLPIRKVLLRQLVLQVTHDVRVIMVKIAGRLVWLRNAHHWDDKDRQQMEARKRLAQEALDVVVPWCDALGLDHWRQELQELSFRYLMPEQYRQTLELMQGQRDSLHEIKDQVMTAIQKLLHSHQIEAQLSGRVKTHYAVYRKMQTYELSYDEVWDRIGIRILTSSIFNCYYIREAIEDELYPDRRRYVDYIENPRKPYDYQSLHLTVCGPNDTLVEIQIRTYDMHIKGEYGVAAHWKMYGGGDSAGEIEDTKFAFLRTQASKLLGDPLVYLGNTLDELLFNNAILPTDTDGYLIDPLTGSRIHDSAGAAIHYRNVLTDEKGYVLDPYTRQQILSENQEPIWYQGDVLPDRLIVYTPLGDLRSVRNKATALDFAYYIHEEVGHTCVGAIVNGKIERLDYTLKMGDQVSAITRKGSTPSMDWLYNGFIQTKRAREKIKRFFREKSDQVLPEVSDLGHTIIKKRLSNFKVRDLPPEKLAERMRFKSLADFEEAVGAGDISIAQLDEELESYLLESMAEPDEKEKKASVLRDFELLYQQAQCCLPLPGDATISYVSQDRHFTLHRSDCRNVATLDPERIRPFEWQLPPNAEKQPLFSSRLMVLVGQPARTLLEIKETASKEGIHVESIRRLDTRGQGNILTVGVQVPNVEKLLRFKRKLEASDDIMMVKRTNG